jgi:hypothetical protein
MPGEKDGGHIDVPHLLASKTQEGLKINHATHPMVIAVSIDQKVTVVIHRYLLIVLRKFGVFL